MEVIKKTILQAVTTGITACTGTTGTCYVIIPDLSVTYHMKIGLKQETEDVGFFDVANYVIVKTVRANYDERSNELEFFGEITSGNSTRTEYGILFTTDSSYSTDDTLIYENYPSNVKKFYGTGIDIIYPYNYDFILDERVLIDTKYYYRAYAINNDEIFYGTIKNITTNDR